MALRHNIHNKRKSLNMTLENLAKIVGTSKQTIQRYESGVIGNIPSDNIEKMANALGCTPADLMGWSDKVKVDKEQLLPSETDLLTQEIFEKYGVLFSKSAKTTPEQLKKMMKMFDIMFNDE